jgi:hypothetical protein
LRLKGIAHGANAACARRAQHRPQHGGKHVRVLVRVDVRETQPAALENSICARVSASISAARMRPVKQMRRIASVAGMRPSPRLYSVDERGNALGAQVGSPSTNTTWQPTPAMEWSARDRWRLRCIGARHQRGAGQHPGGCSSAMARFTPA